MVDKDNEFNITEFDFEKFVVVWNQRRMGMDTPDIHIKMINWLENRWIEKDKNLLLMAFRASGKSTLAALFAAWILYRNRDLRILVLAADYSLAKKMVRNIKRIIERHPFTLNMKPQKSDQWASDRFTVRRHTVLRDPSVAAHGVTSNITGSRADIVICDDVEVPNTCDTAEKRAELRARLSEINYVLGSGSGVQLYIGTPHNYYTIYAKEPRVEAGEREAFLQGFKRLEIPLLSSSGKSVWPEKYNLDDIDQIKRQSGPNKFLSQMMLKPMNISEGRLDPSLLHLYDETLDYTKELQTLFLGQKKMISASGWWDPAFGSEKRDKSVFAAVFIDEEGNYYLHRLEYITVHAKEDEDEATQQCRRVAAIAKELYLPSLCVEINGIGKFLPAILRNELVHAKAPCSVKEISNTRPKDIRILESFDAVLAARRLYVHRSILQTPFMMEMQEWRPGGKTYDDGIDAVAGAISHQPVRLKRLYGAGGQSWMKNTKNHKAKTDFKI